MGTLKSTRLTQILSAMGPTSFPNSNLWIIESGSQKMNIGFKNCGCVDLILRELSCKIVLEPAVHGMEGGESGR